MYFNEYTFPQLVAAFLLGIIKVTLIFFSSISLPIKGMLGWEFLYQYGQLKRNHTNSKESLHGGGRRPTFSSSSLFIFEYSTKSLDRIIFSSNSTSLRL